jgi:hypothetical protein
MTPKQFQAGPGTVGTVPGRVREGPCGPPPHRSVRAAFPHTAPMLSTSPETADWDKDAESGVVRPENTRLSRW